jgi:hypothetical protein
VSTVVATTKRQRAISNGLIAPASLIRIALVETLRTATVARASPSGETPGARVVAESVSTVAGVLTGTAFRTLQTRRYNLRSATRQWQQLTDGITEARWSESF